MVGGVSSDQLSTEWGPGSQSAIVGGGSLEVSGVSSAVLLHRVSVAEAAAADRAAVRPLASVDAQVAPQVPALTEAAGTDGAAVRPLASVCPQVAPQVG